MSRHQIIEESVPMSEWKEYQKLVLSELQRLNDNIEKQSDKVHKNEKEIAVMTVRSSFWGSLSGTITVIIALFIEYLFRRHN